jgi:hypothetical protein
VEPKEEMGEVGMKDMLARLALRVKIKTNLTFIVESVAPGGLPRYSLKAKRFRDLRERGGSR